MPGKCWSGTFQVSGISSFPILACLHCRVARPYVFPVCYICEEQGKGSRATIGACMQCNKSGCKQQFHVTCAQALGLLCEEAGNYLDNVKYCGYCQHHYSKLKKGGNVKTIPPYKPIPADNGSSDSSPEKESESVMKQGFGGKRKSGGKANLAGGKNTGGKVGGHSPAAGDSSSVSPDMMGESSKGPSPSFNKDLSVTVGSNVTNAIAGNSKFTPSNFIESVMTQAASLQPSVQVLPPAAVVTTASPAYQQTPVVATSAATGAMAVPAALAAVVTAAGTAIPSSATPVVPAALNEPIAGSRLAAVAQEELPPPGKRARSQSTEKNDKGRNKKRGSAGVNNIPSTITTSTATTTFTTTATATTPTTTTTVGTSTVTLTSSSATISTVSSVSNTTATITTTATTLTAVASATATSSLNQVTTGNPGNKRGSRGGHGNSNTPPPPPVQIPPPSVGPLQPNPVVKESPPSSPSSETTSIHSGSRRSKSKKNCSREKEDRDLKLFQNGVSAPHMLGNQLNPSSTMAQKMSDTLSQELEAHSIFNDSSNSTSNLVGPPLHSRVIASVRSGQSSSSSSNSGSTAASASAAGAGTIPQSLDQLLERQWEQGSQFLMEQAQHFDIASLLSCLHQLRAENLRLEEHVNSLLQRRDHLLAVNARLAIPLTSQPPAQVNNLHPGAGAAGHHQEAPRNTRVNNSYLPHPMENGLPPEPSPPSGNMGYPHQHRSPLAASASPADRNIAPPPTSSMRPSPASGGYMMSQSPLNPPTAPPPPTPGGTATTPGVVRSTSGTPDSMRSSDGRRSGNYPVYQVASQNVSQVPVVTTQQMVRRDTMQDLHLKMPASKPG